MMIQPKQEGEKKDQWVSYQTCFGNIFFLPQCIPDPHDAASILSPGYERDRLKLFSTELRVGLSPLLSCNAIPQPVKQQKAILA